MERGLQSGIIIAIVVIAVLVIAVVVDVTCFFTKNAGLTATIVGKRGVKDKDKEAMLEDGKNASDEKHEGNGQMKPQKEEPKPEQPESDEKIKDSTEPTETTPMIQGEKDDKEAILKEEQKEKEEEKLKKSESKSSVTKDSPV